MNLRLLREQKGWTQLRLSQESGVSQTYISELEAGKFHATGPILRKLARAIGVTIDELLGDDEPQSRRCAGNH